jgi:Fe-S cluster biogenesis protein NfuA
MFIQSEATPNPATLKFIPGKAVLATGTLDYRTPDDATASPLASSLFGIEGVEGVFLGQDFISVTKAEKLAWQHLRPAVLGVIMEHYMSGAPVVAGAANSDAADAEAEDYSADDQEIVDTIKELIETRVRPAVANDGGDIVFRGFREGVVSLSMRGACSGCPSSTATLRNGIENMLKHYVPEVMEVRPV